MVFDIKKSQMSLGAQKHSTLTYPLHLSIKLESETHHFLPLLGLVLQTTLGCDMQHPTLCTPIGGSNGCTTGTQP